jgi:hypothetical protein
MPTEDDETQTQIMADSAEYDVPQQAPAKPDLISNLKERVSSTATSIRQKMDAHKAKQAELKAIREEAKETGRLQREEENAAKSEADYEAEKQRVYEEEIVKSSQNEGFMSKLSKFVAAKKPVAPSGTGPQLHPTDRTLSPGVQLMGSAQQAPMFNLGAGPSLSGPMNQKRGNLSLMGGMKQSSMGMMGGKSRAPTLLFKPVKGKMSSGLGLISQKKNRGMTTQSPFGRAKFKRNKFGW